MKGSGNQMQHHAMIKDYKKRFLVSLILTFPILLMSPLVQQSFGFEFIFPRSNYFLFLLSAIVFFYGGWPFLKGLFKEIKARRPGMMTLVALAISVAFLYSSSVVFGFKGKFFFWELATLIDVMLLGHWIEMRSVMSASHALESLVKMMPSKAHLVKKDGKIETVPTGKLKVGDVIFVKPGEKIPSDGIVVSGETSVNESMITGESKPVDKKKGDHVIGGSINTYGVIYVEVLHTGEDTYLSQVIKLIKEAQQTKSKTQDLANKAAMWLTLISITIGLLTFFSWLAFGKTFAFAIERMVTVMVITCPHALGLAVPLVISISTTISAKKGFLIRNRTAFERAWKVDIVIFDKTGTLTQGKFGITDILTVKGYTRKDVLYYAASVEANSEHPIAKAVFEQAKRENIKLGKVHNFSNLPGIGITGRVNNKRVMIVGLKYIEEKDINADGMDIKKLLKQGKTIVFVLVENKIIGALALSDIIRGESKEAMNNLKSMGIKCMMITGDNKQVAKWVSKELNLDGFFANILPHEKSEIIKKLQSNNLVVAMVGDGINDAPALTKADVGIAIGAGTDVAIESADIVLVRSDPRDVVSIINLARATYNKIKQNLLWATGYNFITIPMAAGIFYKYGILLSPAMGAALMSLSTIIVAINARLLRVSK